MDLKEIRAGEIERRKRGEKTNINTPEMQDLRWKSYGKSRKQLMPAMIEMYDYICDRVSGGRFLDVGAGEGELIWKLASNNKCDEYYGVDISQVRIDWNNEKLQTLKYDNVYFMFSYARDLIFGDNSFDFVATTATLEHVTHPKKAISEIMRVLKPGGKAFFGIPIEPAKLQPINSPDHYNFYTDEQEILNLFDGLNVISTKLINPNLIVEIQK